MSIQDVSRCVHFLFFFFFFYSFSRKYCSNWSRRARQNRLYGCTRRATSRSGSPRREIKTSPTFLAPLVVVSAGIDTPARAIHAGPSCSCQLLPHRRRRTHCRNQSNALIVFQNVRNAYTRVGHRHKNLFPCLCDCGPPADLSENRADSDRVGSVELHDTLDIVGIGSVAECCEEGDIFVGDTLL